MANPRKFSEKIALHNQKQAEETARFEKIMREVSDATNKVNAPKKQHLRINQSLGSIRASSLPNVNNSTSMDFKSGFSPIEDLKYEQGSEMVVYRERARSTVGPMRSRPAEKRIDTSPYSGSYLSPPPDTSWRRTHSDSSLHTSSHEQNSQRRGGLVHNPTVDGYPPRKNLTVSSDEIPRSSSDVPRVPGINIFPSQHDPGIVQIPIGNNTGSLPDLTNFHFPSPLNTPIDQDDHSSPYTNSSQCGSPSSLSPTSLHHSSSGRFNFGATSPHEHPGPPPQYNMDGCCTQYQCQENTPDLGYFSTSPSQHQQYSRRPHPAFTQTTPNTSSSIPDIVLTDYSNNDGLPKGFGVAVTGHLDTDLYFTDECLRQGLDPIDFDGLQILTDPEMITDPATEDHFRLDIL